MRREEEKKKYIDFHVPLPVSFWLDEGSCGSSDVILGLDVSRASLLNTKLSGAVHYGFLCSYFENLYTSSLFLGI